MVDYSLYKPLFEAFGIEDYSPIVEAWQEPHRVYHSEDHLAFLLEEILASSFDAPQKDILRMAAFMHDIVCMPAAHDNEEKSNQLFLSLTKEHPSRALVSEIIMDTKTHESSDPLSKAFGAFDMKIVTDSTFDELWIWERKVFKEYQIFDYSIYKAFRINLLQGFEKKYPQNAHNIRALIQYLQIYRPKVGIYPGSFNPFHIGHLNILLKAENVFDKVIIASGVNPEKERIKKELQSLQGILYYRQVEHFEGLLTDYISSKESHVDATLIRGLRNGDDLSYEMNQLNFMRDMKLDLKTIFLHCDKEFEHISSSALRSLEKIGKGHGDRYLP